MTEMKPPPESRPSSEESPEKEPNWNRIYLWVAGFFALQVGLFYLFTQYYR